MATAKPGVKYSTAFSTYAVAEIVGEGGAGTVYRVTDGSGEAFALKLLRNAATQKKKRFQNEIRFCLTSQHPNIIRILDHGVTADGDPFYVMPLYPHTLSGLLEKLPPEKVLPYFDQILSGIEAAHNSGVCHRDLKPENVLFDKHDDKMIVADFGVAGFQEEELYTAVETKNERLGNFLYSAPEQRGRGKEVTHLADIYSLGLLLNRMFTGEVPQGTGYRAIGHIWPNFQYLDGLVEKMIAQAPEKRPQSIGEVKLDLKARGNEFVRLQQLDRLKKQTVPATEIQDALVNDPIKPIEVLGYQDGYLRVQLSQGPNMRWMGCFQNQGNFQAVMGSAPANITFQKDVAYLPTSEHSAQQVLQYFKGYVIAANELYQQGLRTEARNRDEANLRERKRQIEAAEKERSVLNQLKL